MIYSPLNEDGTTCSLFPKGTTLDRPSVFVGEDLGVAVRQLDRPTIS